MIKHIVMWKVVEDFDGMKKNEILEKMSQDLKSLIGKIDAIKSLEIGLNCNLNEQAADIVLITTHDDFAGLKEYAEHPEHKKVAAFIGKVKITRACVDYEI